MAELTESMLGILLPCGFLGFKSILIGSGEAGKFILPYNKTLTSVLKWSASDI